MQHGISFTEVWHKRCFAGAQIWYDTYKYKHTNTYSTLRVNRLTHPYKYTLIPPVMCTQQLSILHRIMHWYQKFAFHNFFTFQKLLTCQSHIFLLTRCNKTKFFLWNTNDTDKSSLNKQNTHTKHLKKDHTGKGYSVWQEVIPLSPSLCPTMTFIVQNFQKILRVDRKLSGCTIFEPKIAHLPQMRIFS